MYSILRRSTLSDTVHDGQLQGPYDQSDRIPFREIPSAYLLHPPANPIPHDQAISHFRWSSDILRSLGLSHW